MWSQRLEICPNVNELESLFHAGRQVRQPGLIPRVSEHAIQYDYWSSTSDAGSPEYAWVVRVVVALLALREKVRIPYSPPSVRGGITSGLAQVWQTGQTKCYDASGAELLDLRRDGPGRGTSGREWHGRIQVHGDRPTA